jgi:MFS family permease
VRLRTFAILFICHAVPLFIGMGLFPLLPLYAARLGATRTDIGIFYAVVYVASTAGVLGTGWLAPRVSRRVLFFAGATLGIPALALMGHATALWQVVVLTAFVWFCGGVTLTLLSVFAGVLAEPASRGRVFGLMFLVYPVDALVGGTVVGQLTTAYGYTLMFYALAAIWVIQPVVGLLGLNDPRIMRAPARPSRDVAPARLGRPFTVLLVASLLGFAGISIGRLGISLSMQAIGFAPAAVASTAMVSGLLTIPLTLPLGTLADRLGGGRLLTVSYLLAAVGTSTLVVATALWHFQLAATLLLMAWCLSRAAASALAVDLLPAETLAAGLPRLGAMDSLASIVGFALAGFVMDTLGGPALFAGAAALAIVALAVLAGMARVRRNVAGAHSNASLTEPDATSGPARAARALSRSSLGR